MGPRKRRRLAVGSVVAAVIVAVVLSVLLTRSSTPSGHAATTPFEVSVADTRKIVFGMSVRQVRRLLGQPTANRGRCWRYRATPFKRSAKDVVETDVTVCFYGGRVSDMTYQDYVRRHGKLVALPQPKSTIG